MIYKDRLQEFRRILKKQKLDAFIIPNNDAWQSEHPDPASQRLGYICGLDASAGYVVITRERAAVLIDARYTLSAKDQIDTDLFDIEYYTDTPPIAWAIANVGGKNVIGYDPWLHTRRDAKQMQKACNASGAYLTPVNKNPIDRMWNDRPAPLEQKAICLPETLTGLSTWHKLNKIALDIIHDDVESLIIAAPDSLAWLLNMRTIHNPQSPGLEGVAIISFRHRMVKIYTNCDCACFDMKQKGSFKLSFHPFEELSSDIAHFEREVETIQIADNVPDWFTTHLNFPSCHLITKPDPCDALKAIKNKHEQKAIRAAHKRDATAMVQAIDWIKDSKNITEIDIDKKLLELREKQKNYRGVSFDSIVGWNANGAKIHGKPTDTVIKGSGLLLIDSGAQYDDGTTDITRTIGIGKPTKDTKEKFTIVLKAHISLAKTIFPIGTTGIQLDAIARRPLWKKGMDYAHGTGHGVGCFLNVHEGPYGISPKTDTPIAAGMLVSNEPGYYKEGAFGIRHENLMLVQPCKTNDGFLCFETVTKVPFDETCIIHDMLSQSEKKWLDEYQKASK